MIACSDGLGPRDGGGLDRVAIERTLADIDQQLTLNVTGADNELALDDTGETNIAEVGTKLDLARAYVDMGDPDGARSILGEVLNEGDESQKAEAQQLLDNLG